MATLNKVLIMGNAVRAVEVRTTQSGTKVGRMTVALNETRKGKDGVKKQDTTFIDVTLWDKTASVCEEFVTKGSCVLVEGRLKEEKWEKDGKKNSKISVTAERVTFVGGRGVDGGGRQDEPRETEAAGGGTDFAKFKEAHEPAGAGDDDNLPF